MRNIMIILGIAALVAGVGHPVFCAHSSIVLHCGVGVAAVAAAVCYFVAAAKRYRGHWAFVVGIALVVVGFLGLGIEIDDALTGRSEDIGLKVGIICSFSAAGVLSLWSGHKLHRCSLALERVKNAPREPRADQS